MKSVFLAGMMLVAVSSYAAAQTAPKPARIDSRVDSLKYNSNPSTLGPNDSRTQYGLSHRTDSRVRSRVDSLNYNSNPSQFRIVDPRYNVQRF
ncbi:hypothetical protein [Pseudorhodoplanes sp.]|uniref:hypothetical protein n=1 Tax=Pseudorhodoplanes sp. TaxID=1934341 RepID=UPI002C53E70F|nr:hypothetical protein [Pseudorhodoplanes sp.]HWV51986.1 hypothetical protein [Pseudorhodoplanes sp.]